MGRFAVWLSVALAAACNESAVAPRPDAGPVGELTAEQAARVLAKVGDRTITLGDFARALDRIDPAERVRYQSKERRREFLNELINTELLAQEARRRGLDKEPEVVEAERQVLREAYLLEARQGVPSPAGIQASEVRAYYEAHPERFEQTERRRVGAIILTDKAAAERVLVEAQKIETPEAWSVLYMKNTPKKPGVVNDPMGDLAIVGPPGDARSGSTKVPEPVRAAAFLVPKEGGIAPEPVDVEGKYYVVRVAHIEPAHKRTLADEERAIRALLVQEKIGERDRAIEAELRKKFPVHVDDNALSRVKLPPELGGSETPPKLGGSENAPNPPKPSAPPSP